LESRLFALLYRTRAGASGPTIKRPVDIRKILAVLILDVTSCVCYDKVPETKKLFSLFGSIWKLTVFAILHRFDTEKTIQRKQ